LWVGLSGQLERRQTETLRTNHFRRVPVILRIQDSAPAVRGDVARGVFIALRHGAFVVASHREQATRTRIADGAERADRM
jgi:hypothetical protein